MKCYYEVLQVDAHANDDEIKKSYRKLALKWHPDKNLDNSAEAKDQFQLIQQAYEVLSDPQERAFYDKHKDSILRGGFDSDYRDESLNVFEYFTTSCFKGFGDDEKGFYSVYAEVFKKIAAEDSEFDKDLDSDYEVPVFGNSQSSYSDVVHPFYAYWESYSTKKTYSWLGEYDIRQAPNRKVVKLMEKENKKIRDKAKKERNDEVRGLVGFVRKRDKRVQAHAEFLKEKAQENEEKAKEQRQKQIRQRKAEMETYVESDWSKFSNLEKELEEIEANVAEEFCDDSNDDEYVVEDDPLYCIACDKVFKSEKAFSNHENSKKHKENVQSINDMMLEEDKEFGAGEDDVGSENGSSSGEYNVESFSNDDNRLDVIDEVSETQKKARKKKKRKNEGQIRNGDLSSDLDEEDPTSKQDDVNSDPSELDNVPTDDDKSEEEIVVVEKKKKNRKSRPAEKPIALSNASEDELDLEEIEARRRSKKNLPRENATSQKTKSKRKNREDPPTASEPAAEIVKTSAAADSDEISCGKCKQHFSSKNALFKHLKTTGHAVPLNPDKTPVAQPVSSKKKGKQQRK